jgi:lambda family phage portal protein
VGQTRGISWFAPALVTWKLGDQYTESELVQSMLAAAQGGFFVNKDSSVGGSFPMRRVTDANGVTSDVPLDIEVEPGVSRALPPGWEHQPWQPTHPTANYVGFMKAVKRIISRAFGRSYASLTGDLSDVNFSSMRTDRVREMEQNKVHQQDILVRQFLRIVFADWLVMADLSGALGVMQYAAAQLSAFATWMCRGWPWIDPLKDAATAQLEIEMRINSPQRICAERGRDFFEIVDEIAEAQTYAKDKGVTMDAVNMALTVTDDTGTNNTTAAQDANARQLRLTA